MADRRIDQLTESAEIADDDLFVIWKQNISQTRSIQMRNVFNVGIQSIIDRITQWTDVTTDFSITGSTSGYSLTYVKYNSALKQLRAKYLVNNVTIGATDVKLIYNGVDENIVFSNDLFITSSIKTPQISSPRPQYIVFAYMKNSDSQITFSISRVSGANFETGSEVTFMIQL